MVSQLDYITENSQSHILCYITSNSYLCYHDVRARFDIQKIDIGKEKGTPTVLKHGHPGSNTLFVGTSGGRVIVYDM